MTSSKEFFAEHLGPTKVLAIFRNSTPAETVEMCRQAWESGIDLVEVPVQAPEAMDSLLAAVEEGVLRGKYVGAGTVVTPQDLERVIDAGARFAVAPGVDEKTLRAASERGFPMLPGVATSSEIMRASKAGCTWMKAFPASVLGAEWIRAQQGPFPGVRFIATGGIDAQNAPDFLDAGCSGVALGAAFSSLLR